MTRVWRRFNLRLILLLLLLALGAARQIAKENRPSLLRPGLRMRAYVTNRGDGSASLTTGGTLTIVDLVTLGVVKSVGVGPEPSGVRAHPSRDEIWGVSTGGGFVWVLDVRNEQVVARIEVGAQPFAVDFSPDGSRAYVAASGSGTVVAIDCARREVVGRARVGRRPWIARASPDGKLLVVPNRDDNTVALLDAPTLAIVATIPVAPRPEQVVILPDGSKAFVSASGRPPGGGGGNNFGKYAPAQVSVVDLRRHVLLANLPLPATPDDLILEPKEGKLLLPSSESHGLTVIDTWRNEVEGFVLAGLSPVRGVLTSDQKTLFLSDASGHVIALEYPPAAGRAARPIGAGQSPGVCRLTPGEDLLLVVNEDSDDLAVIATRSRRLITLVPVGARPRDLAIKLF